MSNKTFGQIQPRFKRLADVPCEQLARKMYQKQLCPNFKKKARKSFAIFSKMPTAEHQKALKRSCRARDAGSQLMADCLRSTAMRKRMDEDERARWAAQRSKEDFTDKREDHLKQASGSTDQQPAVPVAIRTVQIHSIII